MKEQCFQLGCKQEKPIVGDRVIQGFLAKPISGEEQNLAVAIVKREGEHATEALDANGAPLLPRVDDDLRIGTRLEDMSRKRHLSREVLKIVDLAIEDDDH